jgi:hypothetical protein
VLTLSRSGIPKDFGSGTSPKSTWPPLAPDIPKDSKFETASLELTSTSPAADIPEDHMPETAPAQPTLMSSVFDIPKDSESGIVLSKSPPPSSGLGILQDSGRVISPPDFTGTVPASDIPKNLMLGISRIELSAFDVTPLGPGTLGTEATLTYSTPDESVDSKPYIAPWLSEVCGLEGRSIDSLRGNEAAEIGAKLHSVRLCLMTGNLDPA